MSGTLSQCSGCRKSFMATVRNGLKVSRKCADCRKRKGQRTTLRSTAPTRRFKTRSGSKRSAGLPIGCDLEATKAASFIDSKSYIRIDGRWRLRGHDKSIMRHRIFERDGFKCVFCKKSVTWITGQWHHTRHKERVKDDRFDAGVTSCDHCHKAQHPNQQPMWSKR